jgi:DNA-directed RNA polymerase subunit beta
MPYDASGNPVEVIMNPDAVLSRKNVPQTMELEINQLMDEVFRINCRLLSEGKFDEVRANFKKYKMPKYFKMTDAELIEYHEENKSYQYVTGSYSKIGPKELIQWKEELGISSGITLWDGKTKKKIRQPIMVAEMYLIKLYHLADAVAKVTTEKIPGVHTLVMGKGNITTKGSRHGNMEMDAIVANNMLGYAKRMKAADGDSAGWLLAQSLLSGLILKPGDSYESQD